VHVVFTLPRELAPLALQNKKRPNAGGLFFVATAAVWATITILMRESRTSSRRLGR
jgi:hypothetical protein